MKKDIKVGFICGGERQIITAKKIASYGYETVLYGFDKYSGDFGLCTRIKNLSDLISMSDVLILPLPATSDGMSVNAPFSEKTINLSEIFTANCDNKLFLYGGCGNIIEKYASEHKLHAFDYYGIEKLKLKNALLTVEGVIEIALREMKSSLYESKCLVVGYGRIGKILSERLKAFGAEVYASARKKEKLTDAEMNGIIPVKNEELPSAAEKCSLIVNTVPAKVIDESVLCKTSESTLIIDVASKPGGVDFDEAKKRNINVIWALELPGKTAPETAGRFIAETLDGIIKENADFFGG
ncbi:MAG: dipicolinate synthase subunit DpsA [Clostridiales bacterium]|nr:dipicolinate synthase subunit DpsA [Clostridiales bacterium]